MTIALIGGIALAWLLTSAVLGPLVGRWIKKNGDGQ